MTFLQNRLLSWYKENGREFDWRRAGLSAYQYIIAEILLQRTKAETIAKFYPNFLAMFPSWESISNSDTHILENFLKPVGLYKQRAIRLRKLACYMVENKSFIPNNRRELEDLPFMGQYIANAVELLIQKKTALYLMSTWLGF